MVLFWLRVVAWLLGNGFLGAALFRSLDQATATIFLMAALYLSSLLILPRP